MKVLRVRNIRRLILLRPNHHHHKSLLVYTKINSQNSSFDESLPTHDQLYRRWHNPRSEKIPKGYLPVYVGPDKKRFVIPMTYLSMPDFRDLMMETVVEEFGFEQEGGLKIPCDEEEFEEILFKCLENHKATYKTRKRKWT